MIQKVALFCFLFWAGVAFADKVPPPPEECPPGATPATNHGGPYCRPGTCTTDADCEGGNVCQEQALCIATDTYSARKGQATRQVAEGVCNNGGSCASPATCQSAKRCVPKGASYIPPTSTSQKTPESAPTKPPTTPQTKKGCAVGVASFDASAWLFGVLLLGLLWGRRRGLPRLGR